MKKKSPNPLYVVTNKGKDVEMIFGPLQILWNKLLSIFEGLRGYVGLVFIQKCLEQWVANLKVLLENGRSFFEIILRTLIPAKAMAKP